MHTEITSGNCLLFREVTSATWPDFEKLFEGRGSPKSCWCMVWRATPEEARNRDGTSRKAAIAKRIAAGVTVGLLGYLEDEPVAWCSVAPRSTYRRLVSDCSADEGVWSIACFFIIRKLRNRGITRQVIAAAVDFARSRGATIVEAYPVATDSPSYRFMGFVQTFKKEGFVETGLAGTRRHICQLRRISDKSTEK